MRSKADRAAKLSATEIRRQKEETLLAIRKLELAQKAGDLIPKGDVRERWGRIVVAIKAGVLRLPDRCAPELAAATTAAEAREILRRECESLLKGLAEDVAA
ncbi:MAG: hypothetical protein R2729_03005 [Bryobacteraceae bacterium]